jgi:diguanylate cyclase (GGDEF)-like protein/PAS domain S-box-containing protein
MAEPVQRREERFWALFRESATGVALLDPMGHIVSSNPALCSMLNSAPGELADRWLTELVHPIYKTETTQLLKAVLEGDQHEARSEVGLVKRDGTLAWSRLSLFLARTRGGQPDYGIALFELFPSERKVLDAIHLLATTDDLTGLYNRRGFLLLAEQQWRVAVRKHRELSLVYLDLDGLKSINDTLGHRVGDEAIRGMAEILRSVCRDTDVVARLGGDEFVVLLVEAGEVGVQLLRDRVQQAVSTYNSWPKQPFTLAVSIGVSHLALGELRSVEDLLAEADRKMYEEKRRT